MNTDASSSQESKFLSENRGNVLSDAHKEDENYVNEKETEELPFV